MKKIVTYVALLLVVALLGVSIYFLLNEETPNLADGTEKEPITVSVLDTAISEIFLDNPEGSFHFVKRQDGWKLIFDEEMPTHGNSIVALESMLMVTMAEELIEEDVKSLQKYGLDVPYAKVRYITVDGEEGFLHVGNNIVSTNYYFTIDNKNVYTMPSSEAVFTFLGMGSFVDLTIVRSSLEEIYEVAFRNEKEEIHVERKEAVNGDEGNVDDLFSFAITKPVTANAAPSAVENLFNNFLTINAGKYLPYADETECGISKDGMYFKVKGNGFAETLYLGNLTPDGDRYVKKEGVDGIFLVDESVLSFMSTTTFALIDKHIALYYFDKVSEVEIKSPEGNYTLSLGDKYLVNGTEIEMEDAQDFFQSLISLTYDDTVKDGMSRGEEIITITFTTSSGVDEITYHEYDAMSYAVSKKGVSGFTIQKKYVDKIINLIKGLK